MNDSSPAVRANVAVACHKGSVVLESPRDVDGDESKPTPDMFMLPWFNAFVFFSFLCNCSLVFRQKTSLEGPCSWPKSLVLDVFSERRRVSNKQQGNKTPKNDLLSSNLSFASHLPISFSACQCLWLFTFIAMRCKRSCLAPADTQSFARGAKTVEAGRGTSSSAASRFFWFLYDSYSG